jgi:tetratricopeptide (TPR) repeat protein
MDKIKWMEEYLEEAKRLVHDEGHEPALKLLKKLLYDEPGYGRLHHTLGYIYFYHAEENKKAEQHFRLAIKFEPGFAEPYVDLGQMLYDDDRLDEAIAIYTLGLQAKRPNKTSLLSGAAKAYELKRKYRKAIRHYRAALGHSAELWNCLLLEESISRCKRKQK